MHICRLTDVFSVGELQVLQEVADEKLQEALETLKLHEQDDPSLHNDTLTEGVERYLTLIRMTKERIDVLQRLLNRIEEL